MLINVNQIHKMYGGKYILKDVKLTINENDKIGLVGDNGCGKSTFVRILTGEETPDRFVTEDGNFTRSSDLRIGYLAQSSDWTSYSTVLEHMSSLGKELFEIKKILFGMGFVESDLNKKISEFSGGEKTRLEISRLLLEEPNLLILDEPTNHLDFKTIMWLEDYLKSYKYAILTVSHDRYFLDRIATSICHIQNGKLERYKGNYSAFVLQYEEKIKRQNKEYSIQQRKIASLEDYIAKNRVRASTAKSAQSRVKKLEKMEITEKASPPKRPPKLRFSYKAEPPECVLDVKNLDISIGNNLLAEDVNFKIRKGDKVAIVGGNGTGKSTLLKMLCGKLKYDGKIKWADNVKISYFEQENTLLNPANNVLAEIHGKFPLLNDLEIRSLLGSVNIVGENVFKQIGVLSGGERAKIRFAVMSLEQGNVLILDEPTNHLDLATKEALEKALCEFEAAVIFVSHDRYLVSRIANRIFEIEDNAFSVYDGNFDFYISQKKLNKNNEENQPSTKKNEKENHLNLNNNSKELRKIRAERRNQISMLEKEIEECEKKIEMLNSEILNPDIYNDYRVMNEKCDAIDKYKNKIENNFNILEDLYA
ncbi:MAG: ATP-binding cassette domain-containing protein [Ruminococcus sp.]|jgi:ATP-binding cassette subfamily F protein 3|nr:ATP-binding cassette domain-containing protein [Ruminococcus sp.]